MFPTFKYMENENRYNLIFNDDEAFIAYLMVVFEDPAFTEEELRSIIVDAIADGLYMYEKYDRTSPLPVYITQVVKTYIQDVKQYLNK
jgi:hypothetical protein